MRYVCTICGYIYDPVDGDPLAKVYIGTVFKDIPEDWCCPLCHEGKEEFEPLDKGDSG